MSRRAQLIRKDENRGKNVDRDVKIFIAASMYFAKQILDVRKTLEGLGYKVEIPADTYQCIENPELNMNDEHCFKTDIMRRCMRQQEACDAIIVLNYSKDGLAGYIGGAVLIELGLAYYLEQKIFLLYPPPPRKAVRYSQEIMHMKPVILNGKLQKFAEYL